MKNFRLVAFLTLVVATIAAFFIAQHLKVSTPLLSGVTPPSPGEVNPVSDRACYDPVRHERVGPRTEISFYLLHASDKVDVYIVDLSDKRIDTVARSRFMKASLYPHEVPTDFTWNGRKQNGSPAPDGEYYFAVDLLHQGRIVTISNESGPLPVVVNSHARCP
jgi:FlgD Ig-like domain